MKDDGACLLHIRDAADRIIAYSNGGKRAFLSDPKTQDAVVRNLEIIGEAAKRVSAGLKAHHPNLPWRQMAGMRDKMIHEYFGVDLEIVWNVAKKELPKLRKKIGTILGGETRP